MLGYTEFLILWYQYRVNYKPGFADPGVPLYGYFTLSLEETQALVEQHKINYDRQMFKIPSLRRINCFLGLPIP